MNSFLSVLLLALGLFGPLPGQTEEFLREQKLQNQILKVFVQGIQVTSDSPGKKERDPAASGLLFPPRSFVLDRSISFLRPYHRRAPSLREHLFRQRLARSPPSAS